MASSSTRPEKQPVVVLDDGRGAVRGQDDLERFAQGAVRVDPGGRRRGLEIVERGDLGEVVVTDPPGEPPVAHEAEPPGWAVGHRRAHALEPESGVGPHVLGEVEVPHPGQRQALDAALGTEEGGDEVVGGRRQQRIGGVVLLEHAADVEHRDLVAQRDRLVDVVGHQDDRLAHLLLQVEQLALEPGPHDGVDGPEGLVHQEHRGVSGQGAGHSHPLLLTAGELGGVPRQQGAIEAHEVDELLDPGGDPAPIPPQHLRDRGHVLRDRAVREEADLLDHVPDVAPQVGDRAVADVVPTDGDRAGRGLDEPVDHAEGGGLAAPGGPDQDHDRTAGDPEVERFDGRPIAAIERLRDAGEDDGAPVGHGRTPDASRVRSTGSSIADPPRTTRCPDVRRERPKRGTRIWVLIRCTLSPMVPGPCGRVRAARGRRGVTLGGRRRAPHGYVHRPG